MFILLPLLQQNEVTDSAYLGSESTYSECETFTDEDTGALVPPEMHEEVETDSGIEATLHDPEDGGNRSVASLTALYTTLTLSDISQRCTCPLICVSYGTSFLCCIISCAL